MTKELIVGGAVVAAGLLTVTGYSIGIYNTFVLAKQDIKNQWSNIATEYQRRADLFMNLAKSVKSMKDFEKSTFTEIAKARSGMKDMSKAEQMAAFKKLNNTFANIMVQLEAYPQLKSNEAYASLMDAIKITENRINIARTDYNAIVHDYNFLIVSFPSNLLAGVFNFSQEKYFEAEKGTEKAPKIEV